MKQLTKEELFNLFTHATKNSFQKKGRFLCRKAVEGETVLTIVGGKLETIKKASKDEVVLRNIEIGSSAETYIIEENKFTKRYDLTDKYHNIDNLPWTEAIAKGKVDAFCYHGKLIEITAPWGETMLCNEGDYIARPIDGDEKDIYRIEKNTFIQTYFQIE